MTLPAIFDDNGLLIADPQTGEMIAVREASDRTLAAAAQEITRLDKQVYEARRAIAAELRERYGVGRAHAAGYGFTVSESRSWPVGATREALSMLAARGAISQGDVDRCMPANPKPDARQLKALQNRLVVSDPDAARVLSGACTVSPPSVKDVVVESVDGEVAD